MLLVQIGMPLAEAQVYKYNALRRFLPTGADILHFDESMSAGIGNWQDSQRAGARKKVRMTMAKHYAQERVKTAAEYKRWILVAVFEASQQRNLTPSWETLRNTNFSWSRLARIAKDFVVGQLCQPTNTGEQPKQQVVCFIQYQPRPTHRPLIHLAEIVGAAPWCKREHFWG